ncbi:MAG: quinone-dependent dihydroorotate dehydrogenase [Candidatus Hydrogenedentes bacterium]|nr:quinone-dependent dihydroorotate dehydrogenase [Candidatus Hydrogenedentota bacterium]
MGLYTRAIRPLLFRIEAERMHTLAIRASELAGRTPVRALLARRYAVADPRLACRVCGIDFANPIGLAAGYDKSGRAVPFLAALGFGFVEIGSVSADPSDGNPRPRLWRLPEARAIIVNYGLPNDGADAVAARLARTSVPVPLGINIVKTNRLRVEPDDAIIDDYIRSVGVLKESGDYLALSLSCPNTETGREFFTEPARVVELLERVSALAIARPLFLKISPLGGVGALERLLEAVDGFPCVSGFIFNLPPGKPAGLGLNEEEVARMPGAVGGEPVEATINAAIRELYARMDRARYRIIGVGGVFSAEDAYRKIRLGASLVQLLTGLVYEGPGAVRAINRGLLALLERDGFASVAEAVGTGSD